MPALHASTYDEYYKVHSSVLLWMGHNMNQFINDDGYPLFAGLMHFLTTSRWPWIVSSPCGLL